MGVSKTKKPYKDPPDAFSAVTKQKPKKQSGDETIRQPGRVHETTFTLW